MIQREDRPGPEKDDIIRICHENQFYKQWISFRTECSNKCEPSGICQEAQIVRLKATGLEINDDDNPWRLFGDERELKGEVLALVDGHRFVLALDTPCEAAAEFQRKRRHRRIGIKKDHRWRGESLEG
jgi:hypothetical protein